MHKPQLELTCLSVVARCIMLQPCDIIQHISTCVQSSQRHAARYQIWQQVLLLMSDRIEPRLEAVSPLLVACGLVLVDRGLHEAIHNQQVPSYIPCAQ